MFVGISVEYVCRKSRFNGRFNKYDVTALIMKWRIAVLFMIYLSYHRLVYVGRG